MPRYVAFLRAINVGKRSVKMDKLQSIFVDAGFSNVTTLIASGNLWLQTPQKSLTKLRVQIEQLLLDSLGFEVETFLRTERQLESIYSANPFAADQARDEQVNVHVFFFHEPLSLSTVDVLTRNQTTTDRIQVVETEVYWHCYGKMTDSVYWTQPDIKKIKLPTNTARNIDTIKRMLAVPQSK